MESLLAIVVPAYKPQFLEAALASIERQTGPFQVYIFDDESPHILWPIIQPFVERNGWVFHRFTHNLGQQSLPAHWSRCVRSTTEPWVWLFSDDDLMGTNCVASWLEALRNSPPHTNVFRFYQHIVNQDAAPLYPSHSSPATMSAFEFGRRRFYREIYSSAVEWIFSRDAFEAAGGFVEFPLGWCADDASWIVFAGNQDIISISGGEVLWRQSMFNISGNQNLAKPKVEAAIAFIVWFNRRFGIGYQTQFFAEQIIWLRLQMVELAWAPTIGQVMGYMKTLGIPFSMNWLRAFGDLYCLSVVYRQKVILGQAPSGFRHWLHRILPRF